VPEYEAEETADDDSDDDIPDMGFDADEEE